MSIEPLLIGTSIEPLLVIFFIIFLACMLSVIIAVVWLKPWRVSCSENGYTPKDKLDLNNPPKGRTQKCFIIIEMVCGLSLKELSLKISELERQGFSRDGEYEKHTTVKNTFYLQQMRKLTWKPSDE